jgi:hypothetical protein
LALLGLVAVSCAIIAVTLTPANLTTAGGYTTSQHAVYITITTIVATLFTAAVESTTRKLLLMRVDRALSRGDNVKRLDGKWRALLGLAGLSERARNFQITIIYFCTGLITTAIVASFSPATTERTYPYTPAIPYGPGLCGAVLSPAEVAINRGYDYYWTFSNSSAYVIPANSGYCPTHSAVALASNINININNPLDFAYADEGVTVHVTAIGTPFSVYSTEISTAPEFNGLFDQYGSNILSTTNCVPIMRQNPISCHPGGSVTISSNESNALNIVSDDGSCRGTSQYLDNIAGNIAIKAFCPQGDVGQGMIVMGGTHSYGAILAKSIRDFTAANAPSPGTPSAITEYLFGVSAAALWQLLSQNDGLDGFPDTITKLTLGDTTGRGPPWAFNDSTNALEDVLGLNAALVASRAPRNVTYTNIDGSVTVSALRVGSGSTFAIAYILPPMITALILVYLILAVEFTNGASCITLSLYDLLRFRGLDEVELDPFSHDKNNARRKSAFVFHVKGIGSKKVEDMDIRPYGGT